MLSPNALLHRRIRRLLLSASTLCLALLLGGPMPSYAGVVEVPTPTALQLTLSPPTGNDRIGVLPLHLVDRDRRDPWVPAKPTRELMVSLWYPSQSS
jgi:hypothetical protein